VLLHRSPPFDPDAVLVCVRADAIQELPAAATFFQQHGPTLHAHWASVTLRGQEFGTAVDVGTSQSGPAGHRSFWGFDGLECSATAREYRVPTQTALAVEKGRVALNACTAHAWTVLEHTVALAALTLVACSAVFWTVHEFDTASGARLFHEVSPLSLGYL